MSDRTPASSQPDLLTAFGPAFRVVTSAAGSSVVQIDADGNGACDMELLLQFVPSMIADDLLF